MAIYSRCGSEVLIVRPVATLDEVGRLENRKTDQHDKDRLSYNLSTIDVETLPPDALHLIDPPRIQIPMLLRDRPALERG